MNHEINFQHWLARVKFGGVHKIEVFGNMTSSAGVRKISTNKIAFTNVVVHCQPHKPRFCKLSQNKLLLITDNGVPFTASWSSLHKILQHKQKCQSWTMQQYPRSKLFWNYYLWLIIVVCEQMCEQYEHLSWNQK